MPSEKQDILSPAHYDDDASSVASASDVEDDHLLDASRTTLELHERDETVLKDEEETEKLLTKPRRFDAVQNMFKTNPHEGTPVRGSRKEDGRKRRQGKKSKRSRRSEDDGDEGELMYEMEEGFKDTSSQASSSSLELEKRTWEGRHDTKVQPRRHRFGRLLGFHTIVIVLFCALAFGAYRASKSYRKVQTSFTLSNGTHLFAPTTILISLDGFRADFLNRGLTPTLNEFIAQGVSPRYMTPSFPSVTFPNHFTLVTGLYPESHGIVGNSFWDPELADEFYYTDSSRSMQPKWWTAEPLWATAEKQGIRTAIHMWPGSEAHIPPMEATYIDKYNGQEPLANKVSRVLGLLDLPGDTDQAMATELRPQLIAAYVPNVDADGHLYGPNSTEIRTTISRVDSMLADLFLGLHTRNLTNIVNIVIVSDHGMATTSNDRLVQLDDIIDLDLVDHIDGWPLRGLRLKNPDRDLQPMYEHLLAESKTIEGYEVYTRETMPERYHFSQSDRIAPLWVIPKAGWAIVERTDFDVADAKSTGAVFHPKGVHGYDHEHPLMRAIAVMRGPAFPHQPNSRMPVFQNVEIYNIVCDSLGIKPHPNNGTLRLPLKPDGVHDEDVPAADDLPANEESGKEVWGLPHDASLPDGANDTGSSANTMSSTDTDLTPPTSTIVSDASEETGAKSYDETLSDESDESAWPEEDGDSEEKSSWFDFFKDRLDAAKDWAKGLVDDLKNKGWHKASQDEDSAD